MPIIPPISDIMATEAIPPYTRIVSRVVSCVKFQDSSMTKQPTANIAKASIADPLRVLLSIYLTSF